MLTAGLDIGGTRIRGVVLDSRFNVLCRVEFPTLSGKKAGPTLESIGKVSEELSRKGIGYVGVGIAGRMDRQGIVKSNPNIPSLIGLNLRRKLEGMFRCPVVFENDAACFAVAEHKLGSGKGAQNMVGLVIGTGVGSGLILGGRLYRGNGEAGEIGHMLIDSGEGSLVCGCGKRGDFESWCSGKSIVKRYVLAGGKIPDPDPRKIYFSGERTAVRVMNKTIEKLGAGLSSLIAVLGPEAIVFGGGVSNLPFYRQVRLSVRRNLFRGESFRTKIVKSAVDDSGAVGAALLAQDRSES
ncbi:ROK family protein [Candidatus Woesearchaeota archaeon]|nr:ROK family protein [Candidatus Woesearchaeota archaeon]